MQHPDSNGEGVAGGGSIAIYIHQLPQKKLLSYGSASALIYTMEIPTILELVNLTLALAEDYDRPRGGTDSGWGAIVLIVAVFGGIGLLLKWLDEWEEWELRRRGSSVRRPSSKEKMPWYVNQKQDED